MRRNEYRELMEALDAAVNNGYEEEMELMSPREILADIVDLTGTRTFETIPTDEIERAIQGWQERNFG